MPRLRGISMSTPPGIEHCENCDKLRGWLSSRHCWRHWKSGGGPIGVCDGCHGPIGPKVSITSGNLHLCRQCGETHGQEKEGDVVSQTPPLS